MCIYKKTVKNRKYTMTKKNRGEIPFCRDERQRWINVPCGQCFVCRKKKAREWKLRLTEEFKMDKNAKVVLLTFSNQAYNDIIAGYDLRGRKIREELKLSGYELDNEVARIAVKQFRERWRKKYRRSIKHWLVTELGQKNTERLHLHGVLWIDKRYKLDDTFLNEVEKIWAYGMLGRGKYNVNTGKYDNYINEKTASYFVKYVNKIDEKHKEYKQIILTSSGIGKSYLKSDKAKDNIYRGKETNQNYNIDTGMVLPLPEYFRRNLYTDEERERLFSMHLDSDTTYIAGKPYSKKLGEQQLSLITREARKKNIQLGFGDGSKNYERKTLENSRRRKLQAKIKGSNNTHSIKFNRQK